MSYSFKYSGDLRFLSEHLFTCGWGLSVGDGENCDWLVVTSTGSCCTLSLGYSDWHGWIPCESSGKWVASGTEGGSCLSGSLGWSVWRGWMWSTWRLTTHSSDKSTSQDTGSVTLTTTPGIHFGPWLEFLTFAVSPTAIVLPSAFLSWLIFICDCCFWTLPCRFGCNKSSLVFNLRWFSSSAGLFPVVECGVILYCNRKLCNFVWTLSLQEFQWCLLSLSAQVHSASPMLEE